jgi:hypothetical protein
MLDVLEVFRVRAADHPLVLTLAALAVLLFCRRLWRTAVDRAGSLLLRAAAIASAASLLVYALSAIWYAADPHFFDNAEPTMIAVGWLFHAGQPIYPSIDAAERYAHVYGPLAFMIHGSLLGAVGPSIQASKALGAIAALSSLALVFVSARRRTTPMRALVITGASALVLLMFRHYSFWTRPEPFELLAVAAAMTFAGGGRSAATAIVGVAAGVLVNLKFTGPLYVLPAFARLRSQHGWFAVVFAAAIAAAGAALPFAAFPNVSFGNYVSWLSHSASTGIVPVTLARNIEWAAFSMLPFLVGHFTARPDHSDKRAGIDTAIALAVAMTAVSIAGAKPGAGPYHLIPFVPVIAYLIAWQAAPPDQPTQWSASDGLRRPIATLALVAFVATSASIAIAQQVYLVTTMAERARVDDLADIRAFAQAHDGVIEMGYGKTEWLTLERPVLVFRNNSYLIDQPAVREYQLQGIEWPSATIAAIESCRVDYWLVAKGEEPLSGVNVYPQVRSQPLYPNTVRRAFFENYERVDATTYFDVWRCRRR